MVGIPLNPSFSCTSFIRKGGNPALPLEEENAILDDVTREGRRERRRARGGEAASQRNPDYRSLRNPFLPQPVFSEDQVAAIHDTALRVLEHLGIKVLFGYGSHNAPLIAPGRTDTQMARDLR